MTEIRHGTTGLFIQPGIVCPVLFTYIDRHSLYALALGRWDGDGMSPVSIAALPQSGKTRNLEGE